MIEGPFGFPMPDAVAQAVDAGAVAPQSWFMYVQAASASAPRNVVTCPPVKLGSR